MKYFRNSTITLLLLICILCAAGCNASVPKSAFAMNPQTIADRQLQTRRYVTRDEAKIQTACASLLQDLGFSIDESETAVGLIAGSKQRDATDAGQVVGALLIAAVFGVSTAVDGHQTLSASIVTRPVGGGINVRATFQRVVWNTQGQVSRLEKLDDPEMYQEFFDKLSKSVFLEGHEI